MATDTRKREPPVESKTFRVAEALGKDVGRGIARLDPRDLAAIGAEVGDIVSISGERTAVAKAMPAYADARGKKLVQIDGIIRGNAKAAIDGRVTIGRVEHAPAARIALRSVGEARVPDRASDTRYVGRLLEGLPVLVGDRVRATLFGSRFQDFEVVATTPADRMRRRPPPDPDRHRGRRPQGSGEGRDLLRGHRRA